MLRITLSSTSHDFHSTFDACEMDVDKWISYAQLNNFAILLEVESEAYQQYLRDFPNSDPRD